MKLYKCEFSFIYYAFAENSNDAKRHTKDACNDALSCNCADAIECVTKDQVTFDDGWDGECLVYSDREFELTLNDAIERIGNE